MAGNATVTLINNQGNQQHYDIWIQGIQTSSSTEFSAVQVRDAMQWQPIRRAERFITFQALWPLIGTSKDIPVGFEDIDPSDGFGRMNKFQEAIRLHQMYGATSSTNIPMILNYYNNFSTSLPIYNPLIGLQKTSLYYRGWIKNVEKQYVRFQNLFVTNYSMNIIMDNYADTPPTTIQPQENITYAPTAADQLAYGSSWINIGAMAAAADKINVTYIPASGNPVYDISNAAAGPASGNGTTTS